MLRTKKYWWAWQNVPIGLQAWSKAVKHTIVAGSAHHVPPPRNNGRRGTILNVRLQLRAWLFFFLFCYPYHKLRSTKWESWWATVSFKSVKICYLFSIGLLQWLESGPEGKHWRWRPSQGCSLAKTGQTRRQKEVGFNLKAVVLSISYLWRLPNRCAWMAATVMLLDLC